MINQVIKQAEIADFCDEGDTVSVTAEADNEVRMFHVQMTDNAHRPDLGCWILTDGADGDIDPEDFPAFDIGEIIEYAERFIQATVKEEATRFILNGDDVYLLIGPEKVDIVTRNRNFINKETSSYQREYSDPIATFDTRHKAINHLSEEL